jgi:nicotinate dehydrogenase subunit A
MLEAQAGQCGYCLPGIVMAAKALLAQNPAPSRREIALALDGNLCRCGAHLRIMAAIEAAAQTSAEAGR